MKIDFIILLILIVLGLAFVYLPIIPVKAEVCDPPTFENCRVEIGGYMTLYENYFRPWTF